MIEVIPAINVKTIKEVREQLTMIESWGVAWAQIDVFDGIFTSRIGFNNPHELMNLKKNIKLEAHLMTWEPEHHVGNWIEAGMDRIIFQYEATHQRRLVISEIKKSECEVGISLCPTTPWRLVEQFVEDLDLVHVLGVDPGPSGQSFKGEEILEKIRNLREAYPKLRIEVDGGVNDANIKDIVNAGANVVAAGSYLFENKDPKEALEHLLENSHFSSHT